MLMYMNMGPQWESHKEYVQQMKGKELSRNKVIKTVSV